MFKPVAIIAANPAHWYEDFAFWVSFLTAMSVIVGMVWRIAWRVMRSRYVQQRERLRRELRETFARLTDLEAAAGPDRAELEQSLAAARAEAQNLHDNLGQSQGDVERLRKLFDGLNR